VPPPWPASRSRANRARYRLRPPRPFFALFREADRRALFLPEDLLREAFRALLRAELRLPFLADFLADFLALFFTAFLADFFAVFREEDFLRRLDFLAGLRLGWADRPRALDESSNSYEGVEAGVGAGVFSIGSGSIQPEPDQPISM
jgi:hypothetical protein